MVTVADGRARVRWRTKKLTLEEYLCFVDDNKLVDLTVDQLNQIIDFHGYKKLHKTHKRIMLEAVSTMELMKPSRSTLQDENVSSCAVMSLDDVVKELNELGWQECCVTSLEMLNSVDIQSHHPLDTNSSKASGSKQPKRPRNRLKKLLMIGNGDSDVASYGLVEGGGSQSASRSSVIRGGEKATKLVPKRKRSTRRGGGDGGSGGSALVLPGSNGN